MTDTTIREIGKLPNGHTLFVRDTVVGGREYFSDEIGGGVQVWDTALVDAGTMLAALTAEAGFMYQEQVAKAAAKKLAEKGSSDGQS